MKRYLVDFKLDWRGPEYLDSRGRPDHDWRREVSQANPVEVEGTDDPEKDFESAGKAVAEAARDRFRADYGDEGDLNIEVTRIAEIVPKAE